LLAVQAPLDKRVGRAEVDEVLDGLFPQEVIDPEERLFLKGGV
jgi:hypothetical protein